MQRRSPEHFALLAWPAYLLGFSLFVVPLSDAFLAVWPLRFGTMSWRFGSIGVLSGGLMTPLLGLLIATIVAMAFDHRHLQRVMGILSAVVGVVILSITVIFLMDAAATKSVMEAGGAVTNVQYTVTIVKATIKLLLAAGSAAGLSWAALRTPSVAAQKATAPARKADVPLAR